MENNKIKTKRKIAIDFGRDPERAKKISEDEQKAKEAFRKKYKYENDA